MLPLSLIGQDPITSEEWVYSPGSATATKAFPGTPIKVIVMMRRYAMGQPLWHPLDATHERRGGRLANAGQHAASVLMPRTGARSS